jgi:hypothetical protein
MYKSAVIVCIIGLAFVAGCFGEEVDTGNCTRTTAETKPHSIVHKVDVTPCALAPEGPCEVRRGQNVTINIEFTTKTKISRKAKHSYAWVTNTIDIPFKGVSNNACGTFMRCPVKKNARHSYEGVLPTRTNFPAGTYPTKIKIYQGAKVIFCRMVTIKLV